MYISGRIDMVLEEEEMIWFFIEMQTYFDMEEFVFTFEDKTKKGLPCKPHYHFFGKFSHQRNTVAKWLSLQGKGYYSTQEVKPDKTSLALLYILKQHEVVFTDYDPDHIELLIEESRQYNKSLMITGGFREHFTDAIMKELSEEEITERDSIIYRIIDYVKEWNMQHKDQPLFLPPPQQMLAYVQYYESLYVKSSSHRILLDYQYVIGSDNFKFLNDFEKKRSSNLISPLDI